MSFKQYLESKAKPTVESSLESYRQRLVEDAAGLFYKPVTAEVRKNTLNLREVAALLAEAHYPLADEFLIAARTADPAKVSHAHTAFRRWADLARPPRNITDRLETAVYRYQTALYGQFDVDDAERLVEAAQAESEAFLGQVAKKVDVAVAGSGWNGSKVKIEALYPEAGWAATEAVVTVGEAFPLTFKVTQAFEVSDAIGGEAPAAVRADYAVLKAAMGRKLPGGYMTLYMPRPPAERRFYERIQRDVSLGISAVIPCHVTLTTEASHPGMDVWKVRVDRAGVREVPGGYRVVADEVPVRWIERETSEK